MSDPYPSAPPSYLQPGSAYQPMAAPAGYGNPPAGYGAPAAAGGYGQPTYAAAQPAQFTGLGTEAGGYNGQQQGYSAAGAQQGPAGYSQVHVPLYQANVGPCAAGGGHSIKEEFTACGLVCGILLFPIGLICCLTLKDRTCLRCGMKFD